MDAWKTALIGTIYLVVFGGSVKAVTFYIVAPIQRAARDLASVSVLAADIEGIKKALAEVSAHALTTEAAMIPLARAIRAVGISMREHNWNGTTGDILDYADETEDILRAAAKASCEEAMKT